MHFFSFLGTGRYQPCAYLSAHQDAPSPEVTYVQSASALSLSSLSRVTLFCTEQARQTHGEGVLGEFADHDLPSPVLIEVPSRFDKGGMIKLFEVLVEHLKPSSAQDDTEHLLAFDMTHGFRAQPAVALLVLDYLQAVYPQTQVKHLLYGAWEPGQAEAPLVDLSELWQLREWAAGFRDFHRLGSVQRLMELSRQAQSDYFQSPRSKKGIDKPTLGKWVKSLQTFEMHNSLNAIPGLLGDGSSPSSISELLGFAESDWNPISQEVGRFVAPLKEMLKQTLEPMRADRWDSHQGLEAQLAWLTWLNDHGRYQQALTVGREWAITFIQQMLLDHHDEVSRERAEHVLGSLRARDVAQEDALLVVQATQDETGESAFQSACNMMVDKRNSINHAYMPSPNNDRGAPKISQEKIGEAILAFKHAFQRWAASR